MIANNTLVLVWLLACYLAHLTFTRVQRNRVMKYGTIHSNAQPTPSLLSSIRMGCIQCRDLFILLRISLSDSHLLLDF